MKTVHNIYNQIISLDNLFLAWKEFRRGKRRERVNGKIGLPLGNLTSQLFANVYLNEFDQFVKHELKAKYYIRYADDFVILSDDKLWLNQIIPIIRRFLQNKLKLTLHPNKVTIKTLYSGIDFLGYVTLPHCRILRTKTKKRMLKRVNSNNLTSYQGLLKHCHGYKLRQKLDSRLDRE